MAQNKLTLEIQASGGWWGVFSWGQPTDNQWSAARISCHGFHQEMWVSWLQEKKEPKLKPFLRGFWWFIVGHSENTCQSVLKNFKHGTSQEPCSRRIELQRTSITAWATYQFRTNLVNNADMTFIASKQQGLCRSLIARHWCMCIHTNIVAQYNLCP